MEISQIYTRILLHKKRKSLELSELRKVVEKVFSVDIIQHKSKRSNITISIARQCFCLYSYNTLNVSQIQIQKSLGFAQPSTVSRAIRTITNALELNDPLYIESWEKVTKEVDEYLNQ